MQTVWKLYLTTTALAETETQLEEIGALAQAVTPLGDPQIPAEERPHLIEAYFTYQPIIAEIAPILPPHSDLSVELLPQLDWVSESQKRVAPVHVPLFLFMARMMWRPARIAPLGLKSMQARLLAVATMKQQQVVWRWWRVC